MDKLSPSAIALVPEVREALANLLRPLQTYEAAKFDHLLLAVRDATLAALARQTEEAVVEEAKMAAWEVGLGCNHGAECEGAGRCNECRLTLDAGFRAALPLLLAPEVAKREQAERDLSAVVEEVDRLFDCRPDAAGMYVHRVVCNGDRRQPPGTRGVSCSCRIVSRDLLSAAEAERNRMRAALEEIVALRPQVVADGNAKVGDEHAVDWNTRHIARAALGGAE